MGQTNAVQVTIVVDVGGQVMVVDYIVQMGNANGGILNIALPPDQPAYWASKVGLH